MHSSMRASRLSHRSWSHDIDVGTPKVVYRGRCCPESARTRECETHGWGTSSGTRRGRDRRPSGASVSAGRGGSRAPTAHRRLCCSHGDRRLQIATSQEYGQLAVPSSRLAMTEGPPLQEGFQVGWPDPDRVHDPDAGQLSVLAQPIDAHAPTTSRSATSATRKRPSLPPWRATRSAVLGVVATRGAVPGASRGLAAVTGAACTAFRVATIPVVWKSRRVGLRAGSCRRPRGVRVRS